MFQVVPKKVNRRVGSAVAVCAAGLALVAVVSVRAQEEIPPIELFFRTIQPDETLAQEALDSLGGQWRDGYAAILIDLSGFVSAPSRERVLAFLGEQTGERFGANLNRWRRWMWNRPYDPHPEYAAFKARLFGQIDPRMAVFLRPDMPSRIRLDEVQWGGVRVNGIPPLDHPVLIGASEADYLDPDDVVFGVIVNGDARAYPKRILGWHEMALDRVGGVELTIIYCTLCGTVLPYESEVGGRTRRFGTSGLLYRSNKLFFDEETMSLWSTLEGRPVIGPLASENGFDLRLHPSVTTTWGEWVRQHSDTRVLSLETGHVRDYSEGAAYRDYFATDRLMFDVPETDDRLKNKDEVLVMRIASEDGESMPLAIAADFLEDQPVFSFEAQGRAFLILTSEGGANRVYETLDVRFDTPPREGSLMDATGRTWQVSEDALVASDDPSTRLWRQTANRAFWFGWRAQFPETELIR